MRREAGAIVVISICLLIKLPGLMRDQRWMDIASTKDAVQHSGPGDIVPLQPGASSVLDRPDSIHVRPLSAQDRFGAEQLSNATSKKSGQRSPGRGSPPNPSLHIPRAFLADPLLYLSSALPESLVFLPGVGPVIAERIANAASGKQPFTCWNDLLAVKGIGPKKLEMLKQIANTR
ncbi:MAG: helix-hairpin-helix domain-containing protein [Candidatus Latescibacterota bacterium]